MEIIDKIYIFYLIFLHFCRYIYYGVAVGI